MQTRVSIKQAGVSNLYRNYVLVMLTLVYVFNFIDRQLLSFSRNPSKKNCTSLIPNWVCFRVLRLPYFMLPWAFPLPALRTKETGEISLPLSLGLWSLMTACSGLARNFIQLLLARIGVGVGEAGGSPPAHAMISDYFPPEKRSTALSVYSTGIYFGILIGFLMGGYLNQHLGWRTAFFVLGIPGIIFSLLFYVTVKEPNRGATDTHGITRPTKPIPLAKVLKLLYSSKTFVYLAMATGLHVFCIYGLMNWAPSFLSRLHGMKSVGNRRFPWV